MFLEESCFVIGIMQYNKIIHNENQLMPVVATDLSSIRLCKAILSLIKIRLICCRKYQGVV